MKKSIIYTMMALMFAVGTPAAYAVLSIGTPSPALSPVFGTLVDFDDKATGTVIGAGDYVAWGISSITETTGAGAAFKRYAGSQSQPNYIGTGFGYDSGNNEDTTNMGWDGTIQIDLAQAASQIGVGLANNRGGPETLRVYDSGGVLLESYSGAQIGGINTYLVITRPNYDISRIVMSGDFFAIDDVQFNAIPAPGAILLGSIGVSLVGWLRKRKSL